MSGLFRDAIFPCVQCGYCCTKGTCAYGRWDDAKKQCEFLTAEGKCSKYDEIVALEKDCPYPVMGCGCTSCLFNERRDVKLDANPELFTVVELQRVFFELALTRAPESIPNDPAEVEIEIE